MVTPKEHPIDDLTGFAEEVLRRSGEEVLSYYGKGRSSIKFDEGLVTEAELRVREFFQDRLRVRFPEHRLFRNGRIPEEGYTHEEERYLWVFDALDGVANFQAGIPIWGLSVALLENFWPVLAMFYMPATGDFFAARAGHGAFWRGQAIGISSQETINNETLLLTFSRFHQHYRATFPGKIRDLGCTTAHICYVAMGRAEAALLANESYEGLAASLLIIEAAGGKMHRMDGSRFVFNEYLDGRRMDDHLLAAAPETFQEIRACLNRIT